MKIFIQIAIAISLILSLIVSPCIAVPSGNVQVINASPGDTVNLHGKGTAGSYITLMASTGVTIDAQGSSGQWLYGISLDNVRVPGGRNSFRISASPVSTMTVWGTYKGLKISRDAGVSNGTGAFSVSNVPACTYSLGVEGIANGSKVRLDVSASTGACVDGAGNYTASVNTNGLPAGVYDVYQDGTLVAIVYLGVHAPPAPTPTPTPCPAPGNSPHLQAGTYSYAYSPQPGQPAGVTANATNDTANDTATMPPEAGISSPPGPGAQGGSGLSVGAVLAVLAACGVCGSAVYLVYRKK